MNLRQLLDSPAARQVRAYGLQHKWYLAGAAGLFTLLLSRGRKPLPYLTTAQRDEYYGPIRFVAAPTVNNPEAIRITNDFPSRVVWRSMPIIGTIQIHEAAAESLDAALREIQRKGWAGKIRSFQGSYVPRFVRGSTKNLSSHSYATSIDVNADENPQGSGPTEDQKLIASVFEKHGWYWGDRFSKRDPMHFEYVLKPSV